MTPAWLTANAARYGYATPPWWLLDMSMPVEPWQQYVRAQALGCWLLDQGHASGLNSAVDSARLLMGLDVLA